MTGLRVLTLAIGGAESVRILCRTAPVDGAIDAPAAPDGAADDSERAHLVQLSKRLDGLGEPADTVGWDVWEGATKLLCHHLCTHPELVCGLGVLELGAGVGVAGIAAARCGARCVAISDYDEGAILLAGANIRLNGLDDDLAQPARVYTEKYDWSVDPPPSCAANDAAGGRGAPLPSGVASQRHVSIDLSIDLSIYRSIYLSF